MPDILPPLYAAWMSDILGGEIPPETEATCDSCPMVPRPDEPPSAQAPFHPSTKCCTYHPTLPNFLVGRVLADDSEAGAAGRRVLEAAIHAGVSATPLMIRVPPAYSLLYYATKAHWFGRAPAMRCPYYQEDTGYCSIWLSRESTCATWFCRHARGRVGQRFWGALRSLLQAVEGDLARWCLTELDPGPKAVALLFAPSESGEVQPAFAAEFGGYPNAEQVRALWGRWHGREEEFYRRCAGLVELLDWNGVLARCGPEVLLHARVVTDAYAALLSRDIPERLVPGAVSVNNLQAGTFEASFANSVSPVLMDRRVLDILPYFDGRPVPEALERIRHTAGIEVPEELVLTLVDLGLLVAAGG